MSRAECRDVRPELLAAYLEGEVTRSERVRVDDRLRESAALRRHLEQLQRIQSDLGARVPEAEDRDLAGPVMKAVCAPRPISSRRSAPWLPAVAALALCAGWVFRGGLGGDVEFRAKSDAASWSEGERWAGVQVYRVPRGAPPQRVFGRVASGEGLVFSYTNLGARPFDYLMIFAIDARGEVRWYYPAYERKGTDPRSIGIDAGQSQRALTDIVEHDFAPGPLVVVALFTREALTVSSVEALVTNDARRWKPPPGLNAVVQRIELEVAP